ncbi:antimicrobial peptide microplusin-like [Haemaphysalis longicornis]
MRAVFFLALICAVAYANDEEPPTQEHQEEHTHSPHHHHHHHHHGHHNHSVCELDDGHLGHVLACVEEKVGEAVKVKLDQVRQHLQCDTLLCGIRKVCESNGGTLEGNRGNQTSVFTESENAELRAAFLGCRPNDAAHAHLGQAAPATDAPAAEA